MDPHTPPLYKNYLPSKRIQIFLVICLVIILIITLGPSLIKLGKNRVLQIKNNQPPEPLVSTTSSPSIQSTLNDGIPDWQKIIVGLDPADPASTQLFYERKRVLESEGLWNNVESFTSDNQIGLEIGNKLVQSKTINDETINKETSTVVLGYIEQLEKDLNKYSRIDIEENPLSNLQEDIAYIQSFEKIAKEITSILATNKLPIESYFTTPDSSLDIFQKDIIVIIEKLLLLPVPSGPRDIHLDIINHLYALYQIIEKYEILPTTETLQKFASITLFQTKLSNLDILLTYLNTYMVLGSGEPIR